MLQQVATDAAVTIAVPEGLRPTPGLSALPDTPPQVAGIATFTDGGEHPLTIQVRRGEPHGWESLPEANPGAGAEWTKRFAAQLQVPEAYDFTPGRYDPERGALSLQYKVVGPSAARLMQRAPNSHPLWAATLAEGEDPGVAKCVLDALLARQPSASAAELRARTGITAAACSLPEALVIEYLNQLGTAEFAPAVTTVTYISFFTRLGTIGTLIMAPLDRQQAVDEAAALIWREAEVADAARLPVQSGGGLLQLAQLGGIVLGALLGVLVLGGAVSWLLTRFGLRAAIAVGSSLGLLCALSLVGGLRGGLQLEGASQVGGYLLASTLAFRPLVRWLSSRGGSALDRARSLRRSRGLSTVEYVVVLVLLACVAIGTWRFFGNSVKTAIFHSNEQLDSLASTPLDEVGPSVADSQVASARAGQTLTDPRGGGSLSGDRAGAAGPARQSGAGESRGSPLEGLATGVAQGMLPGRELTPAAPPAAPPPNAGRVLASAAQEPSLLLRGTDIATDFVPWVSNVKDATTAITGVNPVTGEQVGTFGRVAAGVFAIPAAGNLLKYVGKGGKYVLKGGKAAYEAVQTARAGSKVAKAAAREAEQELAERAAKEAMPAAEAAVAAASRRGDELVRHGPINPGPLSPEVANTFRGGSYTANKLGESTTLYRVYGGKAGELGSYWSRTKPSGPVQSIIDSALKTEWGNTATKVVEIKVPPGTTIYEGAAAAQGGLVGGGSQVVIPKVDPGWVIR